MGNRLRKEDLEHLDAEALRELLVAADKQRRTLEREVLQSRRTARTRSGIAERNKSMMFRAHEALSKEIEERKRSEQAARQAMEKAEAAARSKSSFLANMSHELRTPMNGVIGMVELAMAGPLSPEQRECLQTARASAADLLVLLNDILDLSKVEAGQLQIEQLSFSAWDAADEVCAVFFPEARERGVEAVLHVDTSVPATLVGDPVRYRQILKNLVSNAVKFTAAGRIEVRLSYADARLIVEVEDSGIGIPEDRLEVIFQTFAQADASTTRRYGGTGLGLAIVRELAQRMGGDVTVTSVSGQGSTFRVVLALPPGDDVTLAADAVPVMVCLSDARSNAFVRGALGPPRFLIRHPGDPLTGVELALVDEPAPAAVLLRMRGRGIPLVWIGTRPAPARERLLELPMRRRSFLSVLQEVLGEASRPARTSSAIRSDDIRILLVEDHPVNQRVFQLLLGRLGSTCTVVGNGAEAVEAIRSGHYDVVFMDCQMPVMDGYEATKAIRQEEGIVQPVIVALTAHALVEDRRRCLAVGMDHHLPKPVTLDTLRTLLERVVAEVRARRAA